MTLQLNKTSYLPHTHPIYEDEIGKRKLQQTFLFGKKENGRYITDSGLQQFCNRLDKYSEVCAGRGGY